MQLRTVTRSLQFLYDLHLTPASQNLFCIFFYNFSYMTVLYDWLDFSKIYVKLYSGLLKTI